MLSPISRLELLHVCAIFPLFIYFFEYSPVDVKHAEFDLKTNINTHSREYIATIKND